MPKAVFHTPPKDEEEEHVAEEVQPSAVQEHGNENRKKKAIQGQVGKSVAGDISRRDDSKDENQPVDIAALRKFKEEGPHIHGDEDQRN